MSILQTRARRVGMTRHGANLLLLLVAASWGLSYVLLKMGASSSFVSVSRIFACAPFSTAPSSAR